MHTQDSQAHLHLICSSMGEEELLQEGEHTGVVDLLDLPLHFIMRFLGQSQIAAVAATCTTLLQVSSINL